MNISFGNLSGPGALLFFSCFIVLLTPEFLLCLMVCMFYFGRPVLDHDSKNYYQIASIFDMYINIYERVDMNQDGPSLIIEAPPPRPPNGQRCSFLALPAERQRSFSNADSSVVRRRPSLSSSSSSTFHLKY